VSAVAECGESRAEDGGISRKKRAVCRLPRSGGVTRRLAAATVVVCALAAGTAGAQARFEMTDEGTVPGVSGLHLITMRDNALKTCYLVFLADAANQADLAARITATDIPEAIATRDQRLVDLLHGFDSERGAIPGTIIPNPMKYDWQAENAQIEFALTVLAHEFARLEQQIRSASAASRAGITAVPSPCAPAAPSAPTDHLPEKRR